MWSNRIRGSARQARERLLRGLERLEYRGYDSAGICLLEGDGPRSRSRRSASSRTSSVKARRQRRARDDRDRPHALGDARARDRGERAPADGGRARGTSRSSSTGSSRTTARSSRALIADGERFCSETDAEVVAHLVKPRLRGRSGRGGARRRTRSSRGTSRSSRSTATSPDLLVGTRHRCPLLVGVGDGETFLASSITAFSSETRRVKLIEDDEIVAVDARLRPAVTAPTASSASATTSSCRGTTSIADERGYETLHAQGDPRAAARRSARRSRATCTTAPSASLASAVAEPRRGPARS